MKLKDIISENKSINEADVVGKTIFSDGKGKLHFGYYKTDDAVEFVDYKTWKKLSFKDVSKGDTNKDRVINAIVRNQKQFNKKVDYNMWAKKTNPSFEQKMDWFIQNGWINNINKGGIKESVDVLSVNESQFKDLQIGDEFLRFGENGQLWKKTSNKQAEFIKNVGKKTAKYNKKPGSLDVFPPTMDITLYESVNENKLNEISFEEIKSIWVSYKVITEWGIPLIVLSTLLASYGVAIVVQLIRRGKNELIKKYNEIKGSVDKKEVKKAEELINKVKNKNESVNEAKVGEFEIGDFVHFKSKNKTGMVKTISGDKVTIMTMKGDFTGDMKDIQVLYQDDVDSKIKLTDLVKESNVETYHKSFTNAAEAARAYALKKGYDVDEDDWQSQVAFGGKYSRSRPGVGKSHSFTVGLLRNGKPQRKALNFSVYGMESGNFELTAYIN